MYRLSSIILLLLGYSALFAQSQSPHGEELKLNCSECHNSSGWTVNFSEVKFDHGTTDFELVGAHGQIDCKLCHSSMIFSEAPMECASCHTDVHSMSVGDDCIRCHTPKDWLVENIPDLHEENGFPLIGAHSSLSCVECHSSETNLRFDRIGNECINCHREEYESTQNPNHQSAGYSTNCIDCHNPLAFGWEADVVTHDFFPLTKGHDIEDCSQCHTTGNFADADPACVSCHQTDFNQTTSPDHEALGFPDDCAACHTTDPGWMPAEFPDHDGLYFPIYSGKHKGEWSECTECHNNPNDYSDFTCLTCHVDPETSNEHNGISGYVYESNACLVCHPDGTKDGAFDHSSTNFPLLGEHIGVNCLECHANGYVGTPTECFSCHQDDYNAATDPDHDGFPTDCAACHDESGWSPANFDHNQTDFPLMGQHVSVNCLDCHANGYTGTPTDCFSCHESDYTSANDPDHSDFPTNCAACHDESGWSPANFDHNQTDFPLMGQHVSVNCLDCHANGYTGTPTDCFSCHESDYTSA
ncbi:MAG: hypothetical protein KDD63_05835, partial [Bacteroidetes bacterium]|nr:hypothetical protein [Bacteroidota bacterium]